MPLSVQEQYMLYGNLLAFLDLAILRFGHHSFAQPNTVSSARLQGKHGGTIERRGVRVFLRDCEFG
jgi:hypothetical protein